MDNSLAQKAINLALAGKWEEATRANLQIISRAHKDIDALNRLARCYSELGENAKAVETTQKVLEIDPANTIAQKCLDKWKTAQPAKNKAKEASTSDAFLEESGKTRIVLLVNPGTENLIASLDSGDEVKLSAYAHKVSVTDMDGKYIGKLPDDIAARIRAQLKRGVKYQVLIKSIDSPQSVCVFIKETENKTGIASFPPEKIDYVTFTPPELVHKDIPESADTEETAD